MRWTDLNFNSQTWLISGERAKNGRAHEVPLSPLALRLLKEAQQTSTSPFVFPDIHNAKRAINKAMIHKHICRLRSEMGLSLRTHDLRRTATTFMTKAAVPVPVLERILNHSPIGVTARHYIVHSYENEKRAALNAWAETVDQIKSQPTANVLAFTPSRA